MSEPVTITLSDGQAAVFANLDTQESDAQKTLHAIPFARNAAAMAVVLQTYSPEQITGQQLRIDPAQRTITFTVNGPMAVE